MIDAGSVPASPRRYVVTWAHNHGTLGRGDVVVMAVHRTMHYLIRESDMTLHDIADGDGQYIHLAPADEPATPYALAAERLCRAVEVAVLLDPEVVDRSNIDTAEWALREMRDVKNRRIEDLANEYWRGYWAGYHADQDRRLDESSRVPVAKEGER